MKKGQSFQKQGDVSQQLFMRLFEKPLMMIPIENGLSLIEQPCLINEKGARGKVLNIRRPEEDTSTVGQTLAILDYQRIYMKHVFSEDNECTDHSHSHPASKHSTNHF